MKRNIIILCALILSAAMAAVAYDRTVGALEKGEKVSAVRNDNGEVRNTVEFENDRIRVVRFHFDPHAKVPLHNAPDLLAIWLTDSRFKLTFANGTSKMEIHKAGESEWTPAQEHAGENAGDTPLEFIAVQMK